MFRSLFLFVLLLFVFHFFSCKKDKLITDGGAKVQFSKDSVLFDTVFTSIGSSTRNIRVRNNNNQKIKITSIQLAGGSKSAFKINVDGSSGVFFENLEIAAHDSMYIFIQVNINPGNVNSPFIISDSLIVQVNGNVQQVQLEAWGQDAYYHRPDSAVFFKDGTYLAYSVANAVPASYTLNGSEIVWKNDKPHVIYGYFVVDEGQKLKILENTKVYLNYKAGIWVFAGGQIQVLGKKDKEVIFQGARGERTLAGTLAGIDVDFTNEPGQWDRIWINEGSKFNIIDYAIIKNGYIGVQAEQVGDTTYKDGQLTLTNTKIYNMSKWGLYCLAYKVFGGNNVISNCQEHSLNISLGGIYSFIHCTFSNFWNKQTAREVPAVKLNNYNEFQTIPLVSYFGNCIIDGKLDNEVSTDLKNGSNFAPTYTFSSCWIKTKNNDAAHYLDVVKGSSSLKYKAIDKYDFETDNESAVKGFISANAQADAAQIKFDINNKPRNLSSITAGAYESP